MRNSTTYRCSKPSTILAGLALLLLSFALAGNQSAVVLAADPASGVSNDPNKTGFDPFTKPAAPAAAPGTADRAELSKTVLSTSAIAAGGETTLAVVLDIKPHYHAQSATPKEEIYKKVRFQVTLDPHESLEFGKPIYPAGEDVNYPALGELNVYTGQVIVRVPIHAKPDAQAGATKITGIVQYQVCDDKQCYQLEKASFSVNTSIVPANTPVAPNESEFFEKAATIKSASAIQIFGRDLKSDAYLFAFAAAFLVGIIFNVMPCVLPVVPLKAIGFYEVSQHNRGKSIALGAVFSLGLIASFALLGLLVGMRTLEWGELFTKDWFRATIVIVLLVMAISTLGVFNVNLPAAAYRFTPRHDTYVGNFLFGILTAALSTPCTFGMFVGLLAWALAQPAVIGMLLLTTVGVGMAFPYFVLSAFPELARRFPRTGPWAEMVKQMMGFLLLGTAVYFARPFIEKLISVDAFWWSLFGVVAVAAIFLVIRTLQFARRPAPRIVGIAVAVLLVIPSFIAVRQITYHPHDWQPFTEAALQEAQQSNHVALVEFTADWCGNCHYVEAFRLNDRDVVARLKKAGVIMLKADVTNSDAAARPLLTKLNPVGAIPLTALYAPGAAEPILLNGIYSEAELIQAIDRSAEGKQRVALR